MRKTLIATIICGMLAAPVAAQDYPFQGFASDMALGTLTNRILVDSLERNAENTGLDVETSYIADPEVAERVQGQFLEFVDQTSGAEAKAQLGAIFAENDPVQIWAEVVAADNLKPGDAADALAGYWMLNWMMANKDHESQFPAAPIRDQVRGSFATNPAFAALDEAQRQEIAEVLMLNFLIQHAAYSDAVARNDQTMLGQLSEAAVARFQNEMGIDLREIVPTDDGFAPAT